MTLVSFKVIKMASLTRVRFGYFPRKCIYVLGKQPGGFRHKQKVLFHCSTFLNVKGQEIKMPSLSPTMSEGKIVKWLKKEGDAVSPGDVLCDIETDKAVVSMETDEEGILAKIIVPENTKDVRVGTLIALMVNEGEDWKSVEVESVPGQEASVPDVAGSEFPNSPADAGPPTIEVKMPSLSPTMTEGTIVKWLKREGDTVAPGDVLCDIQTDKAVMSMETDEEGILAKILVPDDTKDVKIGTLIALIVAEGEDWKSVVVPRPSSAPKSSGTAEQPSQPSKFTTFGPTKSGKRFGPAVRSLLEIYQLEPGVIKATGRNNRLLKEDVLQHISENKLDKKPIKSVPPPAIKAGATPSKATTAAAAPPRKPGQNYVDVELSNMRKVIAKRLTQSKQEIPHSYGNIQCNIDKLIALRKDLQKENIKVSINDFVIKAVATALEQCPEINVHYLNEAKPVKEIDISVAVATDNGLITPIVKSANHKGIVDISSTVRELAGKAKSGKLKPEEFQGGSFTISNLGMFGISHFTAIINPPQCAILAVGGGVERLGPDLKTRTDIRVTLSYDRRAIQDDEAASFLRVVQQLLQDPTRMIVGKISNEVKEEVQL